MDQSPKALPCLCPLPSLCTRSGLVLPGTLVPPQEAGGASSSSSTDPARSPEVRHRRLNSFKQPDWSKEDTGWPGAPARPLRLPRRAALSWEPTAPPTELPWHCCKKAHSSAHPHHPPGGWHRRRERRATLQPAQREALLWGGGRAASPNKAVHGTATLEGALLWGSSQHQGGDWHRGAPSTTSRSIVWVSAKHPQRGVPPMEQVNMASRELLWRSSQRHWRGGTVAEKLAASVPQHTRKPSLGAGRSLRTQSIYTSDSTIYRCNSRQGLPDHKAPARHSKCWGEGMAPRLLLTSSRLVGSVGWLLGRLAFDTGADLGKGRGGV